MQRYSQRFLTELSAKHPLERLPKGIGDARLLSPRLALSQWTRRHTGGNVRADRYVERIERSVPELFSVKHRKLWLRFSIGDDCRAMNRLG